MGVTGNGEGGLRERHAAGPFMLQREHLLDLSKSACRAQTAEGQALGSRSGAGGGVSSQLLAVPTLPVR